MKIHELENHTNWKIPEFEKSTTAGITEYTTPSKGKTPDLKQQLASKSASQLGQSTVPHRT